MDLPETVLDVSFYDPLVRAWVVDEEPHLLDRVLGSAPGPESVRGRAEQGRRRGAVRLFGRWFPRRRPPNRTCAFQRIRLSLTHGRVGHASASWRCREHAVVVGRAPVARASGRVCLVPRGRDLRSPVAIALDAHRRRVIQRQPARPDGPCRSIVAVAVSRSTAGASCEASGSPAPRRTSEVAEGPFRRAVPEVASPAPKDRVQRLSRTDEFQAVVERCEGLHRRLIEANASFPTRV